MSDPLETGHARMESAEELSNEWRWLLNPLRRRPGYAAYLMLAVGVVLVVLGCATSSDAALLNAGMLGLLTLVVSVYARSYTATIVAILLFLSPWLAYLR